MSIRVYLGPTTIVNGVYRAKAELYCAEGHINFFPSNLDGTPASTWVITIGRASDWSAANADSTIDELFPDTGLSTPSSIVQALRNTTIGQLSTNQQIKDATVLDKYGVPRSDFTDGTLLAKVLRRTISWCIHQDENYGLGFQF